MSEEKMVAAPATVIRMLARELGVAPGEQLRAEVAMVDGKPDMPDPARFTFGDLVVIPNHGWDLHESNISVISCDNLDMVDDLQRSIMGGPELLVFRKIDPGKPAYIAFLLFEGKVEPYTVAWMEV